MGWYLCSLTRVMGGVRVLSSIWESGDKKNHLLSWVETGQLNTQISRPRTKGDIMETEMSPKQTNRTILSTSLRAISISLEWSKKELDLEGTFIRVLRWILLMLSVVLPSQAMFHQTKTTWKKSYGGNKAEFIRKIRSKWVTEITTSRIIRPLTLASYRIRTSTRVFTKDSTQAVALEISRTWTFRVGESIMIRGPQPSLGALTPLQTTPRTS